jgi:5'-deoxynucleotidase YfbR-like HD superfamily hydrolase
MTTIKCSNGQYFDFAKPECFEHSIEHIAESLANVRRFAGQSLEYNVAQHSCLVADIVACFPTSNLRLVKRALLHDAHEAFTGDIPGPMKQFLTGLKALEVKIQAEIEKQLLGLYEPRLTSEKFFRSGAFKTTRGALAIKKADLIALKFEAHRVFYNGLTTEEDSIQWTHLDEFPAPPPPVFDYYHRNGRFCWTRERSAQEFIKRFNYTELEDFHHA